MAGPAGTAQPARPRTPGQPVVAGGERTAAARHVRGAAAGPRDEYPLEEPLDAYIAGEHTVGRVLDLGVITPRLPALYRWSAKELGIPEIEGLRHDTTPAYAWDPHDAEPWSPPPTRLVRAVRRVLPPPDS